MRRHFFIFVILGLVIIFGILHLAAELFYFYWAIWWFDYLMHFLGGLIIGLLTIWAVYGTSLSPRVPGLGSALAVSIAVVIAFGIGWEIFEYFNGLTQSAESYGLDVAHDLFSDLMGAIVASVVGVQKRFYSTA